ncbi:MAG TPA: glycosyltransferase family 2 protein [Thermoanaerobaculia bacterium]|nr:glycosyltransferase family 2 protein [Thermoanaerobaculia bacterium]
MSKPIVSIVTATWNRSQVLRYALEAALASPFSDFELLVIGDACTDDTADVIASLRDPRVRFINLPKNHGEQSAPNNAGIAIARGRYIALLNHDDLWLPEHLPVCLDAIAGADLVFTRTLVLLPDGSWTLSGVTRGETYEPWTTPIASSWLLRRELAGRIGPWRSAKTIHAVPSQDWLFRAWKSGARLRAVPQVTLISIPSGGRKDSYAKISDAEHREMTRRLREEPRLVDDALADIAARSLANEADLGIGRHLSRAAKNVFRRAAVAAGYPATSIRHFVFHRKRGGYVDSLRRMRGLPPLPAGE